MPRIEISADGVHDQGIALPMPDGVPEVCRIQRISLGVRPTVHVYLAPDMAAAQVHRAIGQSRRRRGLVRSIRGLLGEGGRMRDSKQHQCTCGCDDGSDHWNLSAICVIRRFNHWAERGGV